MVSLVLNLRPGTKVVLRRAIEAHPVGVPTECGTGFECEVLGAIARVPSLALRAGIE